MSALVVVDFPTPGLPVMPMIGGSFKTSKVFCTSLAEIAKSSTSEAAFAITR